MRKIIAIAVLVLLVAGCVDQGQVPTAESDINVHDSVTVEVIQGDYIVDDIYAEILDEQLNESMDQTEFNQMDDALASDLSQFYYE